MNAFEIAILRCALGVSDKVPTADGSGEPTKNILSEGLRRLIWLQESGRADLHVVGADTEERFQIDDAEEEALFKIGAS